MPRPVVPILRSPRACLAGPVECAMHRQDQRGVLGDPQRVGRHVQALRPHAVHLGHQRLGIDHHAVADDAQLAAHQPARQQRQLVGLVAHHQRVAGVVAALEPHDDVGAARQPVDDLALALVAPLGADHRDVGHCVLRTGRRHAQSPSPAGRGCSSADAPRRPRPRRGTAPATVAKPRRRSAAGCGGTRPAARIARGRAGRAGAARSSASGNSVRPVAGSPSPPQVAAAPAQLLVPARGIDRHADRRYGSGSRGTRWDRSSGAGPGARVRSRPPCPASRSAAARADGQGAVASAAIARTAGPATSSSSVSMPASRAAMAAPPPPRPCGRVQGSSGAAPPAARRPPRAGSAPSGGRVRSKRHAGQRHRRQRLGADQRRSRHRPRAVGADQLDPGLADLPVRRQRARRAPAGTGPA